MKSSVALASKADERYLTAAQAGELLGGISGDAVRQRVHRGTIPAWCYTRRLGPKSIRFIRTALIEFLEPASERSALQLVHTADSTRGRRFRSSQTVGETR